MSSQDADIRESLGGNAYYKYAPLPGGRIVDRVPVNGAEQDWPAHTVRYVSRRWIGPVYIRAQGVELNIRYVGMHVHVDRGLYPLHTHPHSEFLFTLSGRGTIHVPGRGAVETCEPGHVVVMPPLCRHQSRWSIRTEQEPWRIIVVNFDIAIDTGQLMVETGETVDLAFAPFYEWFFIREQTALRLDGEERLQSMEILKEIGRSLTEQPYGVCSDIVAGLIRTISIFSRRIRAAGLADGSYLMPPLISKEAALLKARTLMDHGGVQEAGSVTRLARTVGMSESHFIREFKRTYGVTPKQYSLDVLMRRAAALMIRTDITVKDAAFQLGYEDPSSFSRAFTRHFGIAPRAYQQRHTR